jgi:hypothetical protein
MVGALYCLILLRFGVFVVLGLLSPFRVGCLDRCAVLLDFAVFLELLRDVLIGFMD